MANQVNMRYYKLKKQVKNTPLSSKLLTQKEVIAQINAHTRFTRRLVELLVEQAHQMDRKESTHVSK